MLRVNSCIEDNYMFRRLTPWGDQIHERSQKTSCTYIAITSTNNSFRGESRPNKSLSNIKLEFYEVSSDHDIIRTP